MTTPETLPDSLTACAGCGTTKSLEEIRQKHPNARSCCPEREMVEWVRADTRPAPVSGWQPIETAPKDQYVLLGYEQQGDEMPRGLMVGVGRLYDNGRLWVINAENREKAWPSSWMPLPPAPGEAIHPAPAVEGLLETLQRIAYGVCRSCQQAAHDARSGCDDPVWGPSDPREEARAALAAYEEGRG